MPTRVLEPGDGELLEQLAAGLGFEAAPEAFLQRQDVLAVVAVEESEPVALAYGHELAHPDGRRTMLLYSLDVVPAARRQGHGRALVEAFVAGAAERGCTEVWVLTDAGNDSAIATYRAASGIVDPEDPVLVTWPLGS